MQVRPMLRFLQFALAALAALVALPGPSAEAHPHVFVDAKAELVFDAGGRIVAVRHIWQFDKAFTAYAIQGLDANNDGKLSQDELKPLADTNVESLKEYDYFTFLKADGKEQGFDEPKEYWLQFVSGRLTLFYTLPLKAPVAAKHAVLDIYDPEYFVAITFVKDTPFKLVDAKAGCNGAFQPPKPLDAGTASRLLEIPADQRDLPSGLAAFTLGLANRFNVSCP